MIAAVYARKSTDQNVADDAKSVMRQIEHARAYCAAKGWVVDDAYVYVDDGVSGAEFGKRPGFLRLMNALAPRAPFGVLVMMELAAGRGTSGHAGSSPQSKVGAIAPATDPILLSRSSTPSTSGYSASCRRGAG